MASELIAAAAKIRLEARALLVSIEQHHSAIRGHQRLRIFDLIDHHVRSIMVNVPDVNENEFRKLREHKARFEAAAASLTANNDVLQWQKKKNIESPRIAEALGAVLQCAVAVDVSVRRGLTAGACLKISSMKRLASCAKIQLRMFHIDDYLWTLNAVHKRLDQLEYLVTTLAEAASVRIQRKLERKINTLVNLMHELLEESKLAGTVDCTEQVLKIYEIQACLDEVEDAVIEAADAKTVLHTAKELEDAEIARDAKNQPPRPPSRRKEEELELTLPTPAPPAAATAPPPTTTSSATSHDQPHAHPQLHPQLHPTTHSHDGKSKPHKKIKVFPPKTAADLVQELDSLTTHQPSSDSGAANVTSQHAALIESKLLEANLALKNMKSMAKKAIGEAGGPETDRGYLISCALDDVKTVSEKHFGAVQTYLNRAKETAKFDASMRGKLSRRAEQMRQALRRLDPPSSSELSNQGLVHNLKQLEALVERLASTQLSHKDREDSVEATNKLMLLIDSQARLGARSDTSVPENQTRVALILGNLERALRKLNLLASTNSTDQIEPKRQRIKRKLDRLARCSSAVGTAAEDVAKELAQSQKVVERAISSGDKVVAKEATKSVAAEMNRLTELATELRGADKDVVAALKEARHVAKLLMKAENKIDLEDKSIAQDVRNVAAAAFKLSKQISDAERRLEQVARHTTHGDEDDDEDTEEEDRVREADVVVSSPAAEAADLPGGEYPRVGGELEDPSPNKTPAGSGSFAQVVESSAQQHPPGSASASEAGIARIHRRKSNVSFSSITINKDRPAEDVIEEVAKVIDANTDGATQLAPEARRIADSLRQLAQAGRQKQSTEAVECAATLSSLLNSLVKTSKAFLLKESANVATSHRALIDSLFKATDALSTYCPQVRIVVSSKAESLGTTGDQDEAVATLAKSIGMAVRDVVILIEKLTSRPTQ